MLSVPQNNTCYITRRFRLREIRRHRDWVPPGIRHRDRGEAPATSTSVSVSSDYIVNAEIDFRRRRTYQSYTTDSKLHMEFDKLSRKALELDNVYYVVRPSLFASIDGIMNAFFDLRRSWTCSSCTMELEWVTKVDEVRKLSLEVKTILYDRRPSLPYVPINERLLTMSSTSEDANASVLSDIKDMRTLFSQHYTHAMDDVLRMATRRENDKEGAFSWGFQLIIFHCTISPKAASLAGILPRVCFAKLTDLKLTNELLWHLHQHLYVSFSSYESSIPFDAAIIFRCFAMCAMSSSILPSNWWVVSPMYGSILPRVRLVRIVSIVSCLPLGRIRFLSGLPEAISGPIFSS